MHNITRRDLLKVTGSAAALTGLGAGLTSPATTLAADPANEHEDIRLAVIGVGGRGGQHVDAFSACKGVKLVAFCDVDKNHLQTTADKFEKSSGTKVERYEDYRKLLENDQIDAVTIATPNHWHVLIAIHAMQAGKHVYVEKPVCQTVWEGRQLVNAAKQYDVITAAGFQNRSVGGLIEAMELIHSGKFGAIKQIRGLCYRTRKGIGNRDQPLTPPAGLNYDMWLGPSADLPIMRPKLHYDWHWDFNTGNGDMGNQGPHEMDLVRYALGDPLRHPEKVQSFGGRFAWGDAGNTPNMQCALFDYGNGIPVIFEVRNLYQREADKKFAGAFGKQSGPNIIVTMEQGEFTGGRGGGVFKDSSGKAVHWVKGGDDHYQNFVDAVRNNDQASIRSTVESAYYSSCMSHLANISLLVGDQATDQELVASIGDNALASECFERFNEQLDIWKVDRNSSPWQSGPELTFDSATEQFTAGENFEKANALLRREDREPYTVPEIAAPGDTNPANSDSGFTSLFDGKTLDGWKVIPEKQASDWKVKEGIIVAENPDKEGSNLWTTKKYRDYEIQLEYQALTDYYDTGVFVRGDGHQVQIGISGSLKIDLTACIYAPADKKGSYPARTDKVTSVNKPGDWNTLRFIVKGKRIQTFLNGQAFVDYEGVAINDEGPIGLQLHAHDHMKVQFRNIQVKTS